MNVCVHQWGPPLVYLLAYTPYTLVCITPATRHRPRTVSYSHHHLHPLHEQCKPPFSDAADWYVPIVDLGATVGAAVGVAVTVDPLQTAGVKYVAVKSAP